MLAGEGGPVEIELGGAGQVPASALPPEEGAEGSPRAQAPASRARPPTPEV
jgi:hypothetical protein